MLFPKVNLGGDTMNARRGFSPELWGKFPLAEVKNDPNLGIFFFDDFAGFAPHASTGSGTVTEKNGLYSTFLSQGGAISSDVDEAGGILTLSSDGDQETVVIHQWSVPFMVAGWGGKPFIFEARVRTSENANTKHELFVGMCEKITPTAAVPVTDTAATVSDNNMFGFYRHESDGDQFDTIYNADSQAQGLVKGDAVAITANTWMKLGMFFDGKKLYFFADGEQLADTYDFAADDTDGNPFPNDVTMGLTMAVREAVASGGNSSIDWWAAAQLL